MKLQQLLEAKYTSGDEDVDNVLFDYDPDYLKSPKGFAQLIVEVADYPPGMIALLKTAKHLGYTTTRWLNSVSRHIKNSINTTEGWTKHDVALIKKASEKILDRSLV